MPKRVNPRRRPATMADMEKAKRTIMAEATGHAVAVFLTVLVDKYNMENRIGDVWADINKLSEEVNEGRVSVADLEDVLLREYGIRVV